MKDGMMRGKRIYIIKYTVVKVNNGACVCKGSLNKIF